MTPDPEVPMIRYEVLMARPDRSVHRLLATAPNQQQLLDTLTALYPQNCVVYLGLRDD